MKIKEYIVILDEDGLFFHIEDEVVRCKDCRYGEIDDEAFPWQYFCGYTGDNWNDENHFCSDGEKKEDG